MTKITSLTQNTTPVGTDLIAIVDDPGGSPATQKITLQDAVAGGRAVAWVSDDGTSRNKSFTAGVAANWDVASTGSGLQGTGLVLDAAASRIQITADGLYRVSLSIYFLTTSGSEPILLATVNYNGVKIPGSYQLHSVGTTTVANIHFHGILDTAGTTGQYVEIQLTLFTQSIPLAASYWQLTVERIGNT